MQIKKKNIKIKFQKKFNKIKINKKYKKFKINKKKHIKNINIKNKFKFKKKNKKNNYKFKKKRIINKNNIKKKINKKNIITKNNQKNKYKILKNNLLLNIKKGNIIKNRPPIVTIMGHVNHGKTSLIDCIKLSNIQKNEIGNITQNINAYNIKSKYGKLTLLDTPGHCTFTDMRKKSINISDIVILLIAIDDGIMPQTKEIIKYSNKKKVPILIVLNKIDKINYLHNINIIKKSININYILPNKLFKKNIFIKISTKNNIGINKLIKNIFKISKLLKLKAFINGMASGIILDSSINKNIGPIAKILIKNGTLKKGDIILCNEIYGKIKCIFNDKKIIKKAKPSMAVEISGLSNIPKIAEKFIVVNNKKKAKKISEIKYKINKEKKLEKIKNKNINNILINKNKNNNHNLNIILKTNLLSSIKTIKNSIKKISKKIKIIYNNIGNINENDLIYAKTTNSIIIGFNVQKNNFIKKNINYNIKIYYFTLIYKLIEKLNHIYRKKVKINNKKIILGTATIKNIFKSSKTDIIAGCIINKGYININNKIKITRNKIIIYEGKIQSIKRFKNNVKTVYNNNECGIHIKNFNKIKIGDKITSFK